MALDHPATPRPHFTRQALFTDPNYMTALLGEPFSCRLCQRTHAPTHAAVESCMKWFAAYMPLTRTLSSSFPESHDPSYEEHLSLAVNQARIQTLSRRYARVCAFQFSYQPTDFARPDARAWFHHKLRRWRERTELPHLSTLLRRIEEDYARLLAGYPGPSRAVRRALATLQYYKPRYHPSYDTPEAFADEFFLQFDIKIRVTARPETWAPALRRHYSEEQMADLWAQGLRTFIAKYHRPSRSLTQALNGWTTGANGRWLLLQMPTPTTPTDVLRLARTARAIERDIVVTQRTLTSEAGWRTFLESQ